MTGRITPRRIVMIAALVLSWCALWQTFSIANVASGLVVGSVVTLSRTATDGIGSIRLGPLFKLLGLVLVDLAQSTWQVAYEVLTPTDYTDEGIIAVDVGLESRHHQLLMIVAITLTPGTAVVDADPDTGALYLHLLHMDRAESTIEHVHRLSQLACEALPVPSSKAPAVTL